MLLALAAAPLSAHDFWLASVPPAAPGVVTITAGVGERFPTRTNLRARENWLAEWRVIGERADVPVSPAWRRDNLVMATDVTLPAPGAYLGIAMITPQTAPMKGGEFTDYLKEEGLHQIIAARQAAGETDQPTREKYARYAKIALRNGAGSGAHLTRPVGMAAEFIPATDPTQHRAGSPLTVQLVAEGKPVAGAEISALSDGTMLKAVSDAQGKVTFPIDRAGNWLIKTVHMVRRQPATPTDPQWESFWVTLAFATEGRE